MRESEPLGLEALNDIGSELFGVRDPGALLATGRPIRLHKRPHPDGDRTVLSIELPGASKEEVEVRVVGAEMFVRVRDARRRIALPDSLVGREHVGSELERGRLDVVFAA